MLCENFKLSMKNCQEMWVLYFWKTLKNLAGAQLREIRRNRVISAHANFNRTSKKFLVAFGNEKFICECCSERHFSGYVCLPKNFGTSPAAIFASPIDIEKLINTEGLFIVNPSRVSIRIPNGCCTFQMPLVYNRVCWGFVWCGSGLFSFEKWASGLRDFSGHFWGPGRTAGWFLRGFGVRGAREGSFGVTNQKRDILVAV